MVKLLSDWFRAILGPSGMSAGVCWICGFVNQTASLHCLRCGTLLYKFCTSCRGQVPANLGTCPRCGYNLTSPPPPPPATHMPQPQYYTDPTLRPRGGFSDIILIIRLLIKKRSPIYQASPTVYERLGLDTIARSSKYLGLGLIAFLIGLAMISIALAVQGLAAMLPASIIAALVPAAAFLTWMYMNDRLEPEHVWLVLLAFGWGALSYLPASILNELLRVGWAGRAAFTEEPLKILGVYLIATNQRLKREYNDHLDGLVYGAAAGTGFGFIENIFYIATNLEAIPLLIIPTRIMAMALHMFATGIIGYWIGYLKVYGIAVRVAAILPALVFAIFTHMLWNTIAQFLDVAGLVILYIWAGIMIYYLNKLAKEALIDEYYWGYAYGYAPRE